MHKKRRSCVCDEREAKKNAINIMSSKKNRHNNETKQRETTVKKMWKKSHIYACAHTPELLALARAKQQSKMSTHTHTNPIKLRVTQKIIIALPK